MEAAKKGIITKEMEVVAKKENLNPESIREKVAKGVVAIPCNINHKSISPEGIGDGLKTKINVNLGISGDCKDYENVSKEEYKSNIKISGQVSKDNIFLTKDNWKKVEETSILDTETVKKAADTFIDTNLKVNGVSSGKVSYTHVVALLLDYYRQNSYN